MIVNLIARGILWSIWVPNRRQASGLVKAWQSITKLDDYWFTECPEVPF